ncbi:uncharacterized protein LOC127751100 [Frankliniella occidentalis]|uniref:Uncharacterized protein LOC127751100 n=1 Tax=Frankliniella occidentalis TaxID=133901 RepID=A0A9C6X6T6_FRAOC|nr:uncharacterized protein LOC127751100 [Frankliniella occidentalis]
MNTAQVLLVLAAAALAAEGRPGLLGGVADDDVPEAGGAFGVEEYPAAPYPFAPEALEPTMPVEDADEGVVPLPPRVVAKRSTTVFRPLFATRERDAERLEARDRRRDYWAREEQRRRSAVAARPVYRQYPAQYRPYPAGR